MHPFEAPRRIRRSEPRTSARSGEPAKRRKLANQLNSELGKFVVRDVALLRKLGWEAFIKQRQGRGDLTDLQKLKHPAKRLLKQYKHGVPVILKTAAWTPDQIEAALQRGPHKSALEHAQFLWNEFGDMVASSHFVVLPYAEVKHVPGLRVSPPGVVPQVDRRDRTVIDYSHSGINVESVPIAPTQSMQFGRTLERLFRQLVLADPRFGHVYWIKVDMADGFYRLLIKARDVPKLGIAFPGPDGEWWIAFPITCPMGWTHSPPYFCAVTETIADVANHNILKWRDPPPHRLEADADTPPEPETDPVPHRLDVTLPPAVPIPATRDPSLPSKNSRPLAAVDVFVDDFIGMAQGNTARLNRVRRILLSAIDTVFRPLDDLDSPARKEPISVKKLRKGDACWTTCKKVLGWIIDLVRMTIRLSARRLERLAEILASLPPSQRRINVKKW